jgi:hypothetical protein
MQTDCSLQTSGTINHQYKNFLELVVHSTAVEVMSLKYRNVCAYDLDIKILQSCLDLSLND